MSLDRECDSPPITSVDGLVEVLRAAEKPQPLWRVGLEYEWLPVASDTLRPLPYQGGIARVLAGLCQRGWAPASDQPLTALKRGDATITLEPGGQLELSGAPWPRLADNGAELNEHVRELCEVSAPLGVSWLAMGLRPFEVAAQVPLMPKPRYEAMRGYLPQHGRRALDMMFLSASVQASFDFASEADMVAKMRCAMGVSPVVAALAAASPYYAGQWRGHRSERYAIWREVDPDRCGLLPFVWDDDFGYHRYIEWLLQAPMMFLRRQGRYHDVGGMTFRQLLAGGVRGEVATHTDFVNQLAAVFPEVRLKNVIEVRSADAGPPALCMAVAALWKGLLYDEASRRGAAALTEHLSWPERLAMQYAAAQEALMAHGAAWSMRELAAEALRLAASGLERLARAGLAQADEGDLLAPLCEIVESGETRADQVLTRYGAGPLAAAEQRRFVDENCLRSET